MKYDPSKGIFGNIEKLFTERNKMNNSIFNNKAEADRAITEAEANMVEAVVDEYNAITEG